MSKAGVLIVEDSFIVAFHLQKTLESEGYTIVGAETSGEAALMLLERKRPDLVLMDIMLSGELDGIKTAEVVQSKYNIPVVYITALTDKNTIQRAKLTEPYGYLTKPFEDREIFTIIEMALYKHSIESKLKLSEEKYFSTVRSISDAAVIFDMDFRITYLNPSAEALTEWVLADATGQKIFDVLLLKDSVTGQFPINPVQCDLKRERNNAMLSNLLLVSKKQVVRPIGEGSISPVLDYKGQLIGLVMIFRDVTDRIEKEKLQRDFEKQRLTAMVEGQENERARIAKDLHDGLGQMLNAIKMNINVIVDNEVKSKDLFRLIDEAVVETVRISENLLPAKLRDFDLGTCIKSLCHQLEVSCPAQINFESLGKISELKQSQKINFYRIGQEAINNAIKHARASQITVQLIQEDERIQLIIEDDGCGMNGVESNGYKSMRHGLGNMRDRAEIMGGKLIIESDSNRGTLVIAEAPVNTNSTDV
jgi:PAS domain S-box-containing protein